MSYHVTLRYIIFYYIETVFEKKMKRKIKTSPIGHGEDERWPGRRYTLEKPWVAVDGAATSLRDRRARDRTCCTQPRICRRPRSRGGLSLLTGAGHQAGEELRLCPAE